MYNALKDDIRTTPGGESASQKRYECDRKGLGNHDDASGGDSDKAIRTIAQHYSTGSSLGSFPDGLRITLRSSGEWVSKINATRLRLGRRVYFRTAEVANVLGIR